MGARTMQAKDKAAEIRRTAKIRTIADGIFDQAERKAVLDLVADYEKLMRLKD